MTTTEAILAIDQGTTSSRAILFSPEADILGVSQHEFEQIFPADGWVEHRPADLWKTVVKVGREMVTKANSLGRRLTAIGITNQRETTLIWDRKTGKVIYNAIVWQDRRTAEHCKELQEQGCLDTVRNALRISS